MTAQASLARTTQNRVFDSLLRWVLLLAAICFGTVILWDYGFVGYLLENDTSHISLLIVAIFASFSIYCLFALVQFSRELREVERVTAALEDGTLLSDALDHPETAGGGRANRVVTGFLRDAQMKRRMHAEGGVEGLLESLSYQLRVPGRRGLFVADSLYKLGMLGTVIGFIVMLVSMRDLADFDPETMRGALQQMTGGMAVALLTTITGLVTGLLLRLQFNILDGLAMHILRRVVRLSELFVMSGTSRPRDPTDV